MLKADYISYRLNFREAMETSRGVMHEKQTYFVRVYEDGYPESAGYGEVALFRGLSAEDGDDFEKVLAEACRDINEFASGQLERYPSICFGLDTAIEDLAGGSNGLLFSTAFTSGKEGIPINGLVWMGDYAKMLERVEEKFEEGFRCIKLKIGAIDFESELALIQKVRARFGKDAVIRLDANGAFSAEEALRKMERLAVYDIHSIEQPVKPGNYDAMCRICKESPIAVALDEELIGLYEEKEQEEMLTYVRPAYIVLKPSLVGSFSGTSRWMKMAKRLGIGWWITSALESNVGLNAIAQWTFWQGASIPQGLGTGKLFTNNIDSPLYVENGYLRYGRGDDSSGRRMLDALFSEMNE